MVQKLFARASTLVHNMRYQAQVALDEDIAGLQIAFRGQFQIARFLLRRQRPREAARGQLQGIQQAAQHQPYGCKH